MRIWLKTRRVEKKLTHEEVANKCNISRSFYTHVENGTKTPSVDVAKKIAKILDLKWTIFFEDESSSKEHINPNTA
ncbi:helix-turn-helix domain-containing protein [Bacillus sp. 03113]|uniref:helix-turn-helix domain-containing protein n=1 Tax=Bacillus sp. 03113 TaxID=2578211 RepID=UPI001142E1F6|nr:helix-turn-helix transcriptional regulator [Bacillus sp. 03113]